MPEDYSKSFTEAVAVFQHARMSVVYESQLLILSYIFANAYRLFPFLLRLHTASFLIYRYDFDTKRLEHMKPLPEKLLQSLSGELGFLGPYPFSFIKLI